MAILSLVAVSGVHGAASPAAHTHGYQSAFAAAIAAAALGVVAAVLLLGRSGEPEAVAQAEPAIA